MVDHNCPRVRVFGGNTNTDTPIAAEISIFRAVHRYRYIDASILGQIPHRRKLRGAVCPLGCDNGESWCLQKFINLRRSHLSI